jgi:DNA-binding response OmpR family regulator
MLSWFATDGSLPLSGDAPDLSSHRLIAPGARRGAGQGQDRPPLVMVIDDSPAIRTIVEHTFARIEVRVAAYADGLDAIRALVERQVAVPDLVLLDLDLPRLDGYEVAAVLRTNTAFAETPILMLSGRDGLVDRVRSRIVGASEFIAKPFRTGDLVVIVCGYLGIAPPATSGTPSAGPEPDGR